jgi:hypothetical protein
MSTAHVIGFRAHEFHGRRRDTCSNGPNLLREEIEDPSVCQLSAGEAGFPPVVATLMVKRALLMERPHVCDGMSTRWSRCAQEGASRFYASTAIISPRR